MDNVPAYAFEGVTNMSVRKLELSPLSSVPSVYFPSESVMLRGG